ncbi:MAG: hypothetical protein OXH81_00750 [Gemmatimonadetes bacterium]|nr:hypothetical protein [Gemmatimonadota bacterium]MDE2736567.1 hypothetical protein [Gemmatimonadota bacterium]
MKEMVKYLGVALLVGSTACTLKYETLKGTSLPNPPSVPVKIYVKEFPVESKANVVDPRTANSSGSQNTQYITNALASQGSRLVQITRPSRIEDLSGALLRELRKDKVRIFTQTDRVEVLDKDSVRQVNNPFTLVSEDSDEADLEISGTARITSQRVRKVFSPQTQRVQVEVSVKDLKTGKVSTKSPVDAGIVMTFNSRELEEALAVAVVTSLTQKLLF